MSAQLRNIKLLKEIKTKQNLFVFEQSTQKADIIRIEIAISELKEFKFSEYANVRDIIIVDHNNLNDTTNLKIIPPTGYCEATFGLDDFISEDILSCKFIKNIQINCWVNTFPEVLTRLNSIESIYIWYAESKKNISSEIEKYKKLENLKCLNYHGYGFVEKYHKKMRKNLGSIAGHGLSFRGDLN